MFEHLPYITESTLHYCHNEDLEGLLADVKTPLEPVRRDNPCLHRAIQQMAGFIAQDIHDDELRDKVIGNIWAGQFIVLRLIDAAMRRQRLHTVIGEDRETN